MAEATSEQRKRAVGDTSPWKRYLYFAFLVVVLVVAVVGVVIHAMPISTQNDPLVSDDHHKPTASPNFPISVEPTSAHIEEPSSRPSLDVTDGPSWSPSSSNNPTFAPSGEPSQSLLPSISPSHVPTGAPIFTVSRQPTSYPTFFGPVSLPPVDEQTSTLSQFCVIADVPYTDREKRELRDQLANLPEECNFIVHLGDIQKGGISCEKDRFEAVDEILQLSDIPMFMVPGDNEWNDCPNDQRELGWENWKTHFVSYDSKHWNHTFGVVQQDGRPENFFFVHKRTLYFGLNLVGGTVYPDETAWIQRLRENLEWARSVIRGRLPSEASGVVILGHAQITGDQRHFFNPFRDFMRDELNNRFPVLYLHGDGHKWIHTQNFYDQSNYLRIQTSGGTVDPVLLMNVDTHSHVEDANKAFQYDRRM